MLRIIFKLFLIFIFINCNFKNRSINSKQYSGSIFEIFGSLKEQVRGKYQDTYDFVFKSNLFKDSLMYTLIKNKLDANKTIPFGGFLHKFTDTTSIIFFVRPSVSIGQLNISIVNPNYESISNFTNIRKNHIVFIVPSESKFYIIRKFISTSNSILSDTIKLE